MDFEQIEAILNIHARALVCHCECLAMNSANMMAIIQNASPCFTDAHYLQTMAKWGLIDDKSEPTFDCGTKEDLL